MDSALEEMMLQNELRKLRGALPGIIGSLVASSDGLHLENDLPGRDPDSTAAMAAATLGLGQRISQVLGEGELEEALVRSSDGYVAVYSAGRHGVLIVLAPNGFNLGLLGHQSRAIARTIAVILNEAAAQHRSFERTRLRL